MSGFKFQRLSPVLVRRAGYHFPVGAWTHAHWCPGCGNVHDFAVEQAFTNGARWTFDGNAAAPTFNPSMNIRLGPLFGGKLFKTDAGEVEYAVCHYFLRGGQLQYLADSTHKLRGQTIALPELPKNFMLGCDEIREDS